MATDPARCECGHVWSLLDLSVYRFGHRKTINKSCPSCGREVAVTEVVEDLSDTVTANEIIEVHRLLEQAGKSLEDMTK